MKNKTLVKKQTKQILKNIDAVAEKSKYLRGVADEYQKARDLYFKELEDKENAQKMQWRIDVLNFVISNNTLKEMMSGTTGDGKPWKYPDISSFTENGFKEIEKALRITESIVLKARYADFLWLTKKDYEKAKIAVNSYLELIKKYEEEDKKNLDNHHGLDVLTSFKRAFQISISIKFKQSKVKKELERLIFNFNSNSTSKSKLTIDLIEITINNKKDFTDKNFWEKIITLCEERYKILQNSGNFCFARDYLDKGKKIETSILNKRTGRWDKLIAESYLYEADNHKAQKSFAELHFLIKAIEEYQKLKDYKKVEQLKIRYKEASKETHFNEVRTKIDLSKVVDSAKKQADKFSKVPVEEVFKYLVISPNLFPKSDDVERIANENAKKFVFQSLVGRSIFDQNMNLIRRYSSDEERRFGSILQQFDISLIVNQVYLEIIMEELINQDILTWSNTKSFLKKYSWYKKLYELKDREGKVLLKTQKWINLIEPAIKLYLISLKRYLKNKRKGLPYSDIVLATDSLVMKIEGLIREIFQTLNKPTFVIRTRKKESITIEKDLNAFLIDDFSKQIFSKDLILLIRFLLTEPSGYNLRNNIGHCLIQREHYSFLNLHLLFLIILRLGNYNFE